MFKLDMHINPLSCENGCVEKDMWEGLFDKYGQMTKLVACFMNWVLYKMLPDDLVTRTAADSWFLFLAETMSLKLCVNVCKSVYM